MNIKDYLLTVFLLTSCWIAAVSGFVTRGVPCPQHRRKTNTRGNDAISFRLKLLASELDLGGGAPLSEKETELWLDLRGTAIHPRAAIDYIMEELDDNQEPDLIDKVLLSDEYFQRLLESLDPYTQLKDVLYVPEEAGSLVALSRNGVSFPFGNLIGVPRDTDVAVADPIEALQGISKGNWILFVTEDDKSETIQQLDAMGKFLEIASSASLSLGSTTALDSGLLVQADKVNDDNKDGLDSGGIAIKCSTRASVLQLASIFQNTKAVCSMTTTTTESGILLQEGPNDSIRVLPTAMILPFDINLWEAASLIYGQAPYIMDEE